MIDLYFLPEYGQLYEKIENGTCEVFEYKGLYGTVRNMFIKRKIHMNIDGKTYFDIVNPNGYGGPLITKSYEGNQLISQNKDELVKEYIRSFKQYCEKNHIVSEFVRFHPIVANAQDFKHYYDVTYIRNTVGTNLGAYLDPFQSEFSKSCRKNIKKALEAGVSYRITENPNDLHGFKKIYYSTMNRNEASEYYYFDDDYFSQCLELLGKHIVLVEAIYLEQTIAMGLYFIYDKTIHIHLSGTISEFLYLSPAYILRYAITMWGKEKGYEMIHHGGGRTNAPDDSLYLFKKQFGKNTEFEFCVGKKVWDAEVYFYLCRKLGITIHSDYFPAYRL